MKTINIAEMRKILDKKHNSLEQSLKELEEKGLINSFGECSVQNAIQCTAGFSIEYFYADETTRIKYLQIGLKDQSGTTEKTLTISEEGKLYLSNN